MTKYETNPAVFTMSASVLEALLRRDRAIIIAALSLPGGRTSQLSAFHRWSAPDTVTRQTSPCR